MNYYKNSQKFLSATFYCEMITMLLNIFTLIVGITMKQTQLLGWEITFCVLIAILGICNILSVSFFVIGIKKLKEEMQIENFSNSQEGDKETS